MLIVVSLAYVGYCLFVWIVIFTTDQEIFAISIILAVPSVTKVILSAIFQHWMMHV